MKVEIAEAKKGNKKSEAKETSKGATRAGGPDSTRLAKNTKEKKPTKRVVRGV